MRHNIENLEKHWNHINSGILLHRKFDFNTFNTFDGSPETNNCGTAGCSFGEVPAWCKEVHFSPYSQALVYDHDDECRGSAFIAQGIFGLNENEYYHLFMPEEQNTNLYGGELLFEHSSKEEVNENLRIFIEKVKAGEII